MQTLEAFQNAFSKAVLKNSASETEFIISPNAAERLNIYRQSILDNLRRALSITYPGVWMLLGEECANNVATAFASNENNLPNTGCLDDWGDRFPGFLRQIPELNSLVYLQDFAEYEWLKHLSYRAESKPTFDATKLQSIPEDQIATVILNLLPSVFCYTSEYPLDEIVTIIDDPNAEPINLSDKKTHAIIARPENTVLTFWVAADLWLFVDLIAQQYNLGDALQKTLDQYQDFNLQNALQFLLTEKLIC